MDADLAGRGRRQHVHVSREEEVRAEPADRVGAERVEGDVAEVEQAGEADTTFSPSAITT